MLSPRASNRGSLLTFSGHNGVYPIWILSLMGWVFVMRGLNDGRNDDTPWVCFHELDWLCLGSEFGVFQWYQLPRDPRSLYGVNQTPKRLSKYPDLRHFIRDERTIFGSCAVEQIVLTDLSGFTGFTGILVAFAYAVVSTADPTGCSYNRGVPVFADTLRFEALVLRR